MSKETKICDLIVYLAAGVRLSGKMHVPVNTSSAIRPSDAIRSLDGDFLILSDVTVEDDRETRKQSAIMVHVEAIAYIELPAHGWANRKSETQSQRPSLSMLTPKT